MKMKNPLYIYFILATSLIATGEALADRSIDTGDAVIHYNAVTTDFFDPQIAKLFGIKRSKNRALLTVTVLKKQMGIASQPAKAKIEATAINLNNQITNLSMREIKDGGAIYYIADFPVSHKETFDITMKVVPEGGKSDTLTFRQTFFTD